MRKLLFGLIFISSIAYSQPVIQFFTGFEFRKTGLWSTPYAGPTTGSVGEDPHGFSYVQNGNYPTSVGVGTPYSGNGCGIYQSGYNTDYPSWRLASGIQFGVGHESPHHLWETWTNIRIKLHLHCVTGGNQRFFYWSNDAGTKILAFSIDTDKKINLMVNGTIKQTTTNAISIDTWYLCQLYTTWGTSGVTHSIKINGETLTDATSMATTDSIGVSLWGTLEPGWSTGCHDEIWFDDMVWSTGAQADTNAKALVSMPVSDNARGNWTGASGGTTNLHKAIRSTPPTGNTTATDTTHVKNTNASGNDHYDINMQDYTTAGLPANSMVYTTRASVRNAEAAASGPDTGAVSILSNPADADRVKFIFGHNQGAFATDLYGYACGWFGNAACVNNYWLQDDGIISYLPSVTVGTQPVIRVTKVEATANQVDVDGVYLNFLYIPAGASLKQGRIINN